MTETRNPGVPFDTDWIRAAALDEGVVARRALRFHPGAATTRPAGPPRAEAAQLKRAVACLDLTDLSSDMAESRIERLCRDARAPLRPGPEAVSVRVAAVCVAPASVAAAVARLRAADIPVAAACGFPDGSTPVQSRADEIRRAAAAGAREIDVVIDRRRVLAHDWSGLFDEVRRLREASDGLLLKVILRSGTLPTSSHVVRAGLVCAVAGADFLKTSTGTDAVNATPAAGIAMAEAIRRYFERTGIRVGLKPAGGLRVPADAAVWMRLARDELGTPWEGPRLFRLGASSLLEALRARWLSLRPNQ